VRNLKRGSLTNSKLLRKKDLFLTTHVRKKEQRGIDDKNEISEEESRGSVLMLINDGGKSLFYYGEKALLATSLMHERNEGGNGS